MSVNSSNGRLFEMTPSFEVVNGGPQLGVVPSLPPRGIGKHVRDDLLTVSKKVNSFGLMPLVTITLIEPFKKRSLKKDAIIKPWPPFGKSWESSCLWGKEQVVNFRVCYCHLAERTGRQTLGEGCPEMIEWQHPPSGLWSCRVELGLYIPAAGRATCHWLLHGRGIKQKAHRQCHKNAFRLTSFLLSAWPQCRLPVKQVTPFQETPGQLPFPLPTINGHGEGKYCCGTIKKERRHKLPRPQASVREAGWSSKAAGTVTGRKTDLRRGERWLGFSPHSSPTEGPATPQPPGPLRYHHLRI
ncbi:Teneurin-4 [Manis pentadactyla]|nr:Teneurin-4 [Manis pentadactyla]